MVVFFIVEIDAAVGRQADLFLRSDIIGIPLAVIIVVPDYILPFRGDPRRTGQLDSHILARAVPQGDQADIVEIVGIPIGRQAVWGIILGKGPGPVSPLDIGQRLEIILGQQDRAGSSQVNDDRIGPPGDPGGLDLLHRRGQQGIPVPDVQLRGLEIHDRGVFRPGKRGDAGEQPVTRPGEEGCGILVERPVILALVTLGDDRLGRHAVFREQDGAVLVAILYRVRRGQESQFPAAVVEGQTAIERLVLIQRIQLPGGRIV